MRGFGYQALGPSKGSVRQVVGSALELLTRQSLGSKLAIEVQMWYSPWPVGLGWLGSWSVLVEQSCKYEHSVYKLHDGD
jgi:hypothetical protein